MVIVFAGLLSGVLIIVVALPLALCGLYPTAHRGDWITPATIVRAPNLPVRAAFSQAQIEPALASFAAAPPIVAPVKTRPAIDEVAFTARWPLASVAPRSADIETKPTGSVRLALADDSVPVAALAPSVRVPAEAARIKPAVSKSAPPEKRTVDPMAGVDRYLWDVYERAPVKKDSSGDFTWKDPAAAKRMHLSLKTYVIDGMEPDFREQLYHAGRAMDAAGLHWSMLSAFRDDYRQALAEGFKARPGNSLHGGSRAVGGYGHGRAIDIMNTDGDDEGVWHWIDAHGAQYGLRRPMPGYDPAHIQAGGAWHEIAQSLRANRVRVADKAKPAHRVTAAAKAKNAKTEM